MAGGYSSKKNMAIGRMRGQAIPPRAVTSSVQSRLDKAIRRKQESKMNFIKRKLRNWLLNDEDDHIVLSDSDQSDHRFDHDNTINFSVTNAAGGRIVQVRYYDTKRDSHAHSLHVITPDEDLPTALAHILAIETLGK